MHKSLLIFHTLVQTINSNETQEETEGFVSDTILQIVNVIAGPLKNNIDSLNLPAVLKSPLQKLKSLFKKDSIESKPGNPESENAQLSDETQEASEASSEEREEQ